MIEERPKSLASVEPGVPSLIQDKWYLKFSDGWPPARTNVVGTKPNGTYGKLFQVVARNQVPYDLPYIIPANDYRDVDFSNTTTVPGAQENLYPMQNQTVYEIQLGFKRANFLAQFYVPASQVLSRLEQTTMVAPDPRPSRQLTSRLHSVTWVKRSTRTARTTTRRSTFTPSGTWIRSS